MKPINENFSEIDSLIKSGSIQRAKRLVTALGSERNLSRIDRLQLARFARRVFIPTLGLRLLRTIVRPPARSTVKAQDDEKAEFAACLIWSGVIDEAITLLSEVDSNAQPEALLFLAFAHFARWDYGSAIHSLAKYVVSKNLSDYQRLVGKVNLASALVHERRDQEAATLIEKTLEECRAGNYLFLAQNLWQFKAELHFNRREWAEAQKVLADITDSLQGNQNLFELFVLKWQAIIELYRPAAKGKFGEDLFCRTRALAAELKHWETLRECDYHKAVARQDWTLAAKVYFGTPYRAYRDRLISKLGNTSEGDTLPAAFLWEIEEQITRGGKSIVFDLEIGGISHNQPCLKKDQIPYRLMKTLASDFYRPLSLGEIHSSVFPNKYFNPATSSQCIHQAIKRLREFFHDHSIPLSVLEHSGQYRLSSIGPAQILVRQTPVDSEIENFISVIKKLGSKPFSVVDLSTTLGCSDATSLRIIQKLIRSEKVRKIGTYRGAKYELVA